MFGTLVMIIIVHWNKFALLHLKQWFKNLHYQKSKDFRLKNMETQIHEKTLIFKPQNYIIQEGKIC